MILKELKPRKALNKAFLKVKPLRAEIESFKLNLITLLDKINTVDARPTDESEEHLKNDIRDFLRDTYYRDSYAINTKDKKDLVIHTSKGTDSNVGVIIEAKRPSNKSEMITKENINKKAFQELVLYYLRERITNKNHDVKHLVITNINEWFIFDEHLFERLFASNKKFVKQFENFEFGKKTTHVFYEEIAKPFIAEITSEIEFTYFNIQDYQKPLKNLDKADDNSLIALFKLLSPEHLLKLSFSNDSNSLDKNFYNELLHIIGLTETKVGGKKIIDRLEPKQRNAGSLLENTINQLDSLDKLSRVTNIQQFGETGEQRLFSVGLELCITWVNRILFLKLLEAQLIAYHKGNKAYAFLNNGFIKDYDNLNSLFFMVLARKHDERNERVKNLFQNVPYLNSSLFEPTSLEHEALFISGLEDNINLPFLSNTVIKDGKGKKRTGTYNSLDYIFDFLEAYDFSSEGTDEIQEDNKTLISASVLGLIFEKINGYKDGSFFTPGYITMYMCRETIEKAVIQKFNQIKNWECSTLIDIHNRIEDIKEANDIVNKVRICDPAVGSGHFLVSALNEMIRIKKELNILMDKDGKLLRNYAVYIENDELIITHEENNHDDDDRFFKYLFNNIESQRVQETIFHEKQTIIENCLFGVDINPNSVKICRLRLWIELLKSSYYKNSSELETLPNIDINIKCGNSLISRFDISTDIQEALKKSKWSIDKYKNAVDTYRNAQDKAQKKEMEVLISEIKSDFRSEIASNDPKVKKLYNLNGEVTKLTTQHSLFELDKKAKMALDNQVQILLKEAKKINTEIEEIKSNRIFENSFEWRFEFPEVLNEDGKFDGFDVLIGNPPYINFRDIKNGNEKQYYLSKYEVSEYQSDLFILFIELSFDLLKKGGEFAFIIPNSITNNLNNSKIRKHILDTVKINSFVNTPIGVFPDATVDTVVIVATNECNSNSEIKVSEIQNQAIYVSNTVNQLEFKSNENYYFDFLTSDENRTLLSRIEKNAILLNEISISSSGIKEYETGKGKPPQSESDRVKKVYNSNQKLDEFYRKHIQGNDVNNYVLNWQGGYLKYGEWIAAPREPKFFEGERIIIREIPGKKRLIAAYSNENYTVKNTAHIFKIEENYDTKFIIGILNSKLMGFYFVNKFSERDNVFPKAKLGQCRLLPIVKIQKSNQKPIIELVNEIISIKSVNPNTETLSIEKEIDKQVYKLYQLTEEEIELIETT